MNNHYYNKQLREFARELRTETVSRGVKYLWKAVLSRNQLGVKFKRQRPIDRFIVDFFAYEIGLIVEIDGNSHLNKGDYDAYRQRQLESLGYTIQRFSEGDVLNNIHEVHVQLSNVVGVLKGK
ncbi:MAG: endonuclease domain-containing protein [Fluviicola sp.]|nr:endonuclease domain-containing protein [Fluviicola sp.]